MTDQSSLVIGVPAETANGETRVALVPASVQRLIKAGCSVRVENGAGVAAGFADEAYTEAGASLCSREETLKSSLLAAVSVPWLGDAAKQLGNEPVVIGCCDPLWDASKFEPVAEHGITCFALELLPRITRAQSMDILSSMATVAGYKAVLLAAEHSNRLFPMLMTAAGTVQPAKVFIVGAGVAGLQAIATARRLGAVVSGYDVRPAVKEQVESLGARFVDMDLETGESEQAGGYAREMDEEFYRRQREFMAKMVADSDIVITTAAIPGKKSPLLITTEMVEQMAPGSVVVDLAAERGGNCETTNADEIVHHNCVTILGPTNLPATVPLNASEMYSRNVANFLHGIIEDGQLKLDLSDEIIQGTLVTHEKQIIHPRVRELAGLEPLEVPAE